MPQDFMINTRAIAGTLRTEFGDEAVKAFFAGRKLDHFEGTQQHLQHLKDMVDKAEGGSDDILKKIGARASELTKTKRLSFP